MKKEMIKIPANIKYLTEREKFIEEFGKPFELPNGILNKEIPGCGATTVALTDEHKTIICSPRNELLKNKHEQYPDTLLVIGGVDTKEIETYLQTAELPKILVSYDSVYKLIGCIKYKSDWRVVVDEFQCLLADSSFKSEIELHFLDNSRSFPYVTFLSATPILDKYLEQIDHFKDMNYYQLDWEEKDIVRVYRERTKNPINAALEIVRYYQNGNYPSVYVNGERIYSKECVIFLNSVNNIVNIIKQTELKPEEVNIIVGNSEDNDRQIARIGEGFKRGRIPLKGETHKKFTFCTSTAYAGCDFYSTNAATFVISDCNRPNTAVDIATELVQIAGRQRLACNPFRQFLTFVYNVNAEEVEQETFNEHLCRKVNVTLDEIRDNNNAGEALRAKRIKDFRRIPDNVKYQDSYTMYDEQKGEFVFNRLAYVNEQYCFDVQKFNYQNGVIVKKLLQDSSFDVSENQTYAVYQEQLKHLIKKEPFVDRMQAYCEYRAKQGLIVNLAMSTLESKYPELRYYYEALGADRIKALNYKEKKLLNEIHIMKTKNKIRHELHGIIHIGDRILTTDIQQTLHDVYDRLGIDKSPKAADLNEFFEIHPVKIPTANGRKNGFEIRGIL
ncbi:hypothetical protein KSX68_01945 [Bacteroides caccae]|uniref:DEAD/DEAH box helicase family protein n=1 Tax=Bacteroides caccae TaxID=47678 RepID=UPI001C2CC240|nr:DEAD/DEAH box helicase family protein [Bacteroides caccae]MBU9957007.1 hypothetical protein [Bacteroides caccae]MBV3647717.1 hypothetical protein [Bacteroides caccae]MBV3671857.1 hypothetical protein [Bacteroides caccae]MBV3679107.1 hypothetical protein [Bacteroides caccae]MBV3697127.1 hypothetical protein [Bacteroides caccae]